jgi:hypothetical protein
LVVKRKQNNPEHRPYEAEKQETGLKAEPFVPIVPYHEELDINCHEYEAV